MAVNLTTRDSEKILEKFSAESYVKGNTSNDYEFTSAQTIKVHTPIAVDLVDYTRSGNSRYGAMNEMQDMVQIMTLKNDKALNVSRDAANDSDSAVKYTAGVIIKTEMEQVVAPLVDLKYFEKLSIDAGTVKSIAAPTKSNICGFIDDAVEILDDNNVPQENRILYITSTNFKYIKQSDEFNKSDSLATKGITKGVVGEYNGCKVIKLPKGRYPANFQFAVVQKGCTILPFKINKTKIYVDPINVDGVVVQGHQYFDAFCLGSKNMGVVYATTATKQANPTITGGTGTITVTSASSNKILVTTDGTDPRFSSTATQVATGVAFSMPAGTYVTKAVAYSATLAVSDVTSSTVTVS